MATFTVIQKCEAGHERRIALVDVGNKAWATAYAGLLDGSFNPEAHERMKAINDPAFRVGRCNSDKGDGKLCDAWCKCEVVDGALPDPSVTVSDVGNGVMRATGSFAARASEPVGDPKVVKVE